MTSKSRIIANSGRYVNTDGTPKLGGNITLTTIDGQVSASVERDSTEASVINYSSIDSLPISNLITGTIAFVEDINSIYITDGSGWFSIATVNQTPTVSSGVGSAFDLATDGTPTIITITASDPEGIPLTYTATPDSDFAGLATLSQDSSVFTITPLSEDSATTTSASITFAVSDGVNVAGGVNTFTLLFRSVYWSNVALNIATASTNNIQNYTFNEKSSSYSVLIPGSGDPAQGSFHPYHENWSVYLDGSGDALGIATGSPGPGFAELLFDTSDFTVECWVNPSNVSGTKWIAGIWSYLHPTAQAWALYIDGGVYKFTIDPADTVINTSSSSAVAGVWTHIAVTRSGDTFRMFINGELESTTVSAGYNMAEGSGQLLIGTVDNAPANTSYSGYISNLHTVKGTALYTSNFDLPTEKVTAVANSGLILCQSNKFIDVGPNSRVVGIFGNPMISPFNPFTSLEYNIGENKGSVYIKAAVDRMQISNITAAPGTGSFTAEAWIYLTDLSADWRTIICARASNGSSANQWTMGVNTTGYLYWYSDAMILQSAAGAIKVNQWHHVAISRDGTTTYMHIDGQQVATGTNNYDLFRNVFTVGANEDGTEFYTGYISDVRWTTNSAVYTTSFTPPTSPVGVGSSHIYLPMDNAGVYDATGNHNLVLHGDTKATTSQTKFANTSIFFDGTGDNILLEHNDTLHLGGNFTIEFWIYIQSSGGMILNKGGGSNIAWASYEFLRDASSGKVRFAGSTANSGYDVGGENASGDIGILPQNTWTHVAVTREGNVFRGFVNGVQGFTQTVSSPLYNSAPRGLSIGGNYSNTWGTTSPTSLMIGYIENLQILNGVAKYVVDFTPPTQTQGLGYQQTGLLIPVNTEETAITDISAFEATSPEAGWYYIQPTGASAAALVEYSGPDFKGGGKGYFRWWRSVDTKAPMVNHYGLSWQFDEMLVDLEGVEYQDVIFNSAQTFNSRNSNDVADGGSRAGYRVYFGFAGGHGIYNTNQGTCNWGDGIGSIGAGYDGSCGSFPNDLRIGTGQAATPNYTNRGNTISFWFRW